MVGPNIASVKTIGERYVTVAQAIGDGKTVSAQQKRDNAVVVGQDGTVNVHFLKSQKCALDVSGSLQEAFNFSRYVTSVSICTPSQLVPELGWKVEVKVARTPANNDYQVSLAIRKTLLGLLELSDF